MNETTVTDRPTVTRRSPLQTAIALFWRWPLLQILLPAAAAFAFIAPLLTTLQFANVMEHFTVGTAMEAVRDGHWLIPYLEGQPRTKKPPLAQWITAVGLKTSSSRQWGARWPSCVIGCLILPAVFSLGRVVGGRRLGLLSMIVCASNFLFLKFSHGAAYDIQLALWVIVCNLFIAKAVIQGKWWIGSIGAGGALGLALMTKGPPAIVQTVVPPLLMLAWESWARRGQRRSPERLVPPRHFRSRGWAIATGTVIALAIALPWTIYVMVKFPGRLAEWHDEVALATEARVEHRIGFYSYIVLIPALFPWIAWFVAALIAPIAARGRLKLSRGTKLMYWWLLAPIFIMSFFPERRDRYLLPMLGPACVLTAWMFLGIVGDSARRAVALMLLNLQWLAVAVVGIAFPLAGSFILKSADGGHWFSAGGGILAALVVAALLAFAYRLTSGGWRGVVGASAAVMLLLNGMFVLGYSRTPGGRSNAKNLAEMVLQKYPDATVYNSNNTPGHRVCPLELTIYFDRVLPFKPDLDALEPSDHPQIVLFPDYSPQRPGPPYQRAGQAVINQDLWSAYVLPPGARP